MEKIYLDSSYCNKNSPQKIFYQVIENYYFLSDFEKMVKDTKLTTSIIYEYFVKNKASKIMEIKKCLEDVKNISKETILETEEDLLKKAKNLYIEKKLSEAYEIFYSLSTKNNIESLFYLGAIEEQRKNYKQAFEWFLRSANKGNSNSQALLGHYYEDGLGVEKNLFKAFEWYKKSAEQNNDIGQLFLASCYLGGIGTKVDFAIATEWLKKSANQGNTMAKERLDNIIKEVTVLNKKYFNN